MPVSHAPFGYHSYPVSLVIGICGGSGSGKTTLARRVAAGLDDRHGQGTATVLSFDAYYRDLRHLSPDERAEVNYDHPDSLDGDLLGLHLQALRAGQEAAVPVYDFATHSRTDDVRLVAPTDVVVVEGILLFAFASVRDQLDLSVFRQCPEPIRFARRLRRDQRDRGRTEASVRAQFAATVKPMHDEFVDPFAPCADVTTVHGEELDLVTDRVLSRVDGLALAVG